MRKQPDQIGKNKVKKTKSQKQSKKTALIAGILAGVAALLAIGLLLLNKTVLMPRHRYNEAVALMENGEYEAAIAVFNALDGYEDSHKRIDLCEIKILDEAYNEALRLMQNKEYEAAIIAFTELNGYKDSNEKIEECKAANTNDTYATALALLNEKKYLEAYNLFTALADYKDANKKAKESAYYYGVQCIREKEYLTAIEYLEKTDHYEDSDEQIFEAKYQHVLANQDNANSQVKDFLYELRRAGYALITVDDVENVKGGSSAAMHLHLFTKGSKVAATCSSDGYTNYACSCGATAISDQTSKLEHTFTGGDCQTFTTCSKCGMRSDEYGEHEWEWIPSGAQSHHPRCSVCGEEDIYADERCQFTSYVNLGNTCAEQCGICGYKNTRGSIGHQYENGICTLCGATE